VVKTEWSTLPVTSAAFLKSEHGLSIGTHSWVHICRMHGWKLNVFETLNQTLTPVWLLFGYKPSSAPLDLVVVELVPKAYLSIVT